MLPQCKSYSSHTGFYCLLQEPKFLLYLKDLEQISKHQLIHMNTFDSDLFFSFKSYSYC